MDIRDRILGGITGHIVGNALGHRYLRSDFSNPSQSTISQLLARSYTEAGAMSLCGMASINELGRIDLEDIAHLYHEWYVASYLAATSQVHLRDRVTLSHSMRLYGIGTPPDRCGLQTPRGDNEDAYPADDSALIRILPMAIWCKDHPVERLINQIEQVTKFTNQQVDALVCSTLYALLVRGILNNKREKIADILGDYYKTHNLTSHYSTLEQIVAAKTDNSRTTLLDLFWSMWLVYSGERKDYEKAITLAFQSHEGYESIGCLVGSLIGLTVGIRGIPKRWINQLELPEDGWKIMKQFVNLAGQRCSVRSIKGEV